MSSSTILKREPTHVELEITIAPEALKQAQERAFRELVKNVKLPGFRPGHVPRRVFEQNYGVHTIEERAMEEIVPELYAQALKEHHLDPLERPHMELLPDEDGKPPRFKASVEIRPEIVLSNYKGIAIEGEAVTVSDEDVDRAIESMAKERSTLVPVDRAAALGDIVTIDYRGTIDGVAFDGGTAEKNVVELLDERFIPGFATGIAGMSAGESRDVEAKFPEDYAETTLAGKTAVFAITLHDVKELELPPIDDAFVASISDYATVDELKEQVRKRLHAIGRSRVRRMVGNRIMQTMLDTNDVALPPGLVEREMDRMISEIETEAERNGATFEDMLERSGKTRDELRESLREDAQRRVKGTLLIEAVAKAEGIVATTADINAELHALSARYGRPVDQVQAALGNNILGLMDGIVREKTLDLLIDGASVTPPLPVELAEEAT